MGTCQLPLDHPVKEHGIIPMLEGLAHLVQFYSDLFGLCLQFSVHIDS